MTPASQALRVTSSWLQASENSRMPTTPTRRATKRRRVISLLNQVFSLNPCLYIVVDSQKKPWHSICASLVPT